MEVGAVPWLLTDDGREAAGAATAMLTAGARELEVLDRLRRDHGADRARWAVALAEGRDAAAAKFHDADRLFCDRDAAEQASPEPVADHTAARFRRATRIADLGCGMGADTLALAERAPVIAVDRDPARIEMARANVAVRGLDDRVELMDADALDITLPPDVDAAWCDPSRRGPSGRTLDPAGWSPPLDDALRLVRQVSGGGIKLAPGIDVDALPADAEVEFVSLHGHLVEAVAWLGSLARPPRTATVLPAGASLNGAPFDEAREVRPPGAVLYDPDPAVGRAGLLWMLAERLGAGQMDTRIAYLAADDLTPTPFARAFRVLDVLPFGERALLERLQHLEAGRIEVMRRGSPVDTNALERRLNTRLRGTRVLTAALTRVDGRHTAIVCERLRGGGS